MTRYECREVCDQLQQLAEELFALRDRLSKHSVVPNEDRVGKQIQISGDANVAIWNLLQDDDSKTARRTEG